MTWLGNKNEPEPVQPARTTTPSTPQATTAPAPRPMETPTPAARTASIGKSIHVKGELTGNEDLSIEGKVEGKITLNGCRVTVGATGQVTAEISAKSVIVAGTVKGTVHAEERVEVAATGNLLGDVRSPRVVLADGCRFKGAVDMESGSAGSSASASSSNSAKSAKPKTDPLLAPEPSPMYASSNES